MAERQAMIVSIDDREQSNYALHWTLRHFFSSSSSSSSPNPLFRLVLVHAKRAASSIIGLPIRGSIDVLPIIESDLKRIAANVIENARGLCVANQVNDAVYEVYEGDPRYVLCELVEKYQADVLVVGSHGHGAIKRAVLGSVSNYCAHHAHCTVMIVKKPKPKH